MCGIGTMSRSSHSCVCILSIGVGALGTVKADLDLVSQHLVDATKLYDLDAIYIIREYEVYEKELRTGEKFPVSLDDELKELLAVG